MAVSASSGLTFKPHPLAIVNISDHHTRVKAQPHHSAAVEGVSPVVYRISQREMEDSNQVLQLYIFDYIQVELINELSEDETITVYRCGPLVDLCRGPHIPNTLFVKAFTCLKASSSYWRGSADGESLQRVFGISFLDEKRLKQFYMFGRNMSRTVWRVLKIDRLDPFELNISEDSTTYTQQECSKLMNRIHKGNKSTDGLKFVTSCYGIAGMFAADNAVSWGLGSRTGPACSNYLQKFRLYETRS